MTDASETTEPTPPATEQVTASELNHRDRVLWPVNGRAVECRVDTVMPVKFGDAVVAVKLFLTGPGGRIEADLTPDEPVSRLFPE